MSNKFELPKVGDEIIIISDKYWELIGALKNPYPIKSKWKVKRVIIDENNPDGIVFCENNKYSVPFDSYEIIKQY